MARTWVLSDPHDGAAAGGAPRPVWVRFEKNGFVTGFDGCNAFGYGLSVGSGGPSPDGLAYSTLGNEIRFEGAPLSNLNACAAPAHTAPLHRVLTGAVTFDVDERTLILVDAAGRRATFAVHDDSEPACIVAPEHCLAQGPS